jgi:putative chitobiose transport system permease protein
MRRTPNVTLIAYGFLLPALVLMAVFTFYPVLYGAFLAFTEYTGKNLGTGEPPRWIGLENFRTVFGDELFRIGLLNSLKYLLIVPVLQIVSLAVAVMVNRNMPGITFFRASYYVPVITAISLAAVMWQWIYQRDGLLNNSLGLLGFVTQQTRFDWLLNENTALWAIMFVTFWRGFGYYMVLYLGGLQSIPSELEEAALLDGANRWQIFWKIIVPLMRPTILLCSLLSTLAAIRVLEEILVFTGGSGGPLNSTFTALLYVYRKSIGLDFNYGQASAAGLIVAAIGFVLSYINFRVTREGNEARS